MPARTGYSPIWGKTFPPPVCYNPAVSGFAANFRGVAAAVLLAGGGFAAAADTPVVPPVGTAAQVRALSRTQAKLQPAVTLRGVVTCCRHLTTSDATVQDATGGVWLPEMPVTRNIVVPVKLITKENAASILK